MRMTNKRMRIDNTEDGIILNPKKQDTRYKQIPNTNKQPAGQFYLKSTVRPFE